VTARAKSKRSRKPARRAKTSTSKRAPAPAKQPLPHHLAEIEASPAGPAVAAIFDFDGTLIPGYSVLAFVAERVRQREIGVAEVGRTARMLLEAAAGSATQRDMIEQGMAEWRGKAERDMEALGERIFRRELEPDIFPEMREVIDAHRARGHTLVLASSAGHFQLDPAARHLGIAHVLCTRLEAKGGKLTGRAAGAILWGEHKARAVQAFAAGQGVDLAQSFFYADGDEDEALMHLVGNPRPTNPKGQLARVAARRHWPMRRFTSRGRPAADVVLRNLAATASSVPVFLGAAAVRLLTGRKRDAANLIASTLTDITLALGEVELDVVGEEHLWETRPAVFIWNHRNIFDAQIVGNLVRRDFGAVAKKELESVPIFAAASRFMHIAFVDRSNSQAAVEALKPATALLRRGISMLVAPEGTRSVGCEVGPFKKGAFRMAMEAGVPIVPVIVRNADEIGARNSRFMRPGKVDVLVLPPIDVADWKLGELAQRIESVRRLYVDALRNWPETPCG
jgi:putative phosphoserine phosphatase/1-acylglycerol-3-phosphate O-acyltransferase